MNPDNGFRRFWDQFRETDFGPGERGRRAREDAKAELRKLASQWLLTAQEKKRRRLTGPNGDRNARGRHFFHHLRTGVILSDAELDNILAQSHKDSAKGIRSSPAAIANRQPPAALVAPVRRPAQEGAEPNPHLKPKTEPEEERVRRQPRHQDPAQAERRPGWTPHPIPPDPASGRA